jgi:dipeptidase D
MSNDIRNLEPKALWNHFADLNAVPRPSKKEERVIAFAKAFGEGLGLATEVDEIGNVIIKKPATKGMEGRQTIVIQSHLDMVHQKNNDTDFDFEEEGINMYVDGDWVKARGTTLGADNGIGVASIMALLSSKDIAHPRIEALFTIDEETGMTGAQGLAEGKLEAKLMLNLDTEDDRELTIGCAGGIDITATGQYDEKDVKLEHRFFKINVKGLTGGHSGMDIHLGRANANKLMNRILHESEQHGLRIASVDGGGLRNAIPRESVAVVAVAEDQVHAWKKYILDLEDVLKLEYKDTDPALCVILEPQAATQKLLSSDFQFNILRSLSACPNGIYRMSPSIEGLVQTSNNLARVLIKDGKFTVLCLTRSAVDSEKMDLCRGIKGVFELAGAHVNSDGSYPGWTPNPNAEIIKIMADLYRELYNGEEPDVNACHAGLECGIIGAHYPDMEMISFGPNIRGAHSPDEKVQISSVQKYWKFLLKTLEKIPMN